MTASTVEDFWTKGIFSKTKKVKTTQSQAIVPDIIAFPQFMTAGLFRSKFQFEQFLEHSL